MYPLKDGPLWPRNQWYIAGWAEEFGEAPVERTILGERVLLFRGQNVQSEANTAGELSFRTDHGGIEARRLIQSLIDAEE